MFVPKGFTTVTPYLFVQGAELLGQFLIDAFGGVEIGRTEHPPGVIANLQIRIGTTTLMISEASDAYPAMPAAYLVYVEDADNTLKKALKVGASLEMAVADMSYGDRQGGVRDPFGNIWWITQHLTDEAYH